MNFSQLVPKLFNIKNLANLGDHLRSESISLRFKLNTHFINIFQSEVLVVRKTLSKSFKYSAK